MRFIKYSLADSNETFVIRIAFYFDWDFRLKKKRFTFFKHDNPSIATQSLLHYHGQSTTVHCTSGLTLARFDVFSKSKGDRT